MAVEEGRRAEAWGKAHHLQKLRNWGEASMAAIGLRLRATALAVTRRELPGRVVLVHAFGTSRVSSARTNVVAGQAESFRWLYPVRSMATRSRIRGLMCSTSNVIKRRFYDRDVSAALNIARIAAGPGRPRELSSWLGRPTMPNPGRMGQEWVQVRDRGLLRKWQRRHQRQRHVYHAMSQTNKQYDCPLQMGSASKRGSAQPVKLATPSVSVTPAGPAAPSAPALPPSSTAAGGQASAAARGGVGVKAASPIKAKLPLLLPDKVPRNKALLELVAGGDEAVVDLAGDAGAVGRLSVTGKAGSEELIVDLKGVMFAATILPLAATAMVINIQPNGAKPPEPPPWALSVRLQVEAVFNDFVRLSELRGGWGEEEGEGAGLTSLLAEEDDEEHYMLQGEGEAAEGEATDGSGRKKPAKKAKTGSSKAAGGSAKKAGSKPAAVTAGKPASKGSASGKGGGKTKAGGVGGTRGVKKAAGKKGRG
ncbi:hypothetical protein QJQ45_022887 [Haematococcus lacustris]|nr:hypothetical protein QJQ45_022887 [Haematococcus lacustris]